MTTPYGIPGCIFREDFGGPNVRTVQDSVSAVVANGGVIFDNPTILGRYVPQSLNIGRIEYPKTASLFRNRQKLTIACEITFYPGAGYNHYIVGSRSGGNISCIVTCSGSSTYFFIDGTGTNYASQSLTGSGAPCSLVWVYDGSLAAGSRAALYVNGTYVAPIITGTIPTSISNSFKATIGGFVGSGVCSPNLKTKHISIFDNAFDAASVADYSQMLARVYQ